jgi:hypothetical protein
MRRSTVLALPLQLVFLGLVITIGLYFKRGHFYALGKSDLKLSLWNPRIDNKGF